MSEETFANLLAPNLNAIRRFVKRRMRASENVDDIVQDTVLRAFIHRHQLRADSKFRTWLSSIALNEVRMFHRSSRRWTVTGEYPLFEIADSGHSPYACCVMAERSARFEAAIARLQPRYRRAIRFEMDGLTLSEAATATDSSISAVKSARFRARRQLAAAIDKQQVL